MKATQAWAHKRQHTNMHSQRADACSCYLQRNVRSEAGLISRTVCLCTCTYGSDSVPPDVFQRSSWIRNAIFKNKWTGYYIKPTKSWHSLLFSFASFWNLFPSFSPDVLSVQTRQLGVVTSLHHEHAHEVARTSPTRMVHGPSPCAKLMSLPVNFSGKRLCWGLCDGRERPDHSGFREKKTHEAEEGNWVSGELQRSQDKFLRNGPRHTQITHIYMHTCCKSYTKCVHHYACGHTHAYAHK